MLTCITEPQLSHRMPVPNSNLHAILPSTCAHCARISYHALPTYHHTHTDYPT
ncbi:hypothetical protein FIBSPDRAFT_850320 [Athelia psychrophila]|uniref:Uncharacterized protein n=1 Tax=Athelia psychrophila TaxID=1759441 RepID=A0A166TBN7_9AGAM|nr:hypothetical protein FIBSPDRAFT_850320 [Fibularhizoctonia sp. CBS 109695]